MMETTHISIGLQHFLGDAATKNGGEKHEVSHRCHLRSEPGA
jgi:hypothetical protein